MAAFVPLAKARLDRDPIRLATVANFPEGSDDLARAARDTADALAAGADEIDVVAPIQAILDGDIGLVRSWSRPAGKRRRRRP